jgi:hypothetical protein
LICRRAQRRGQVSQRIMAENRRLAQPEQIAIAALQDKDGGQSSSPCIIALLSDIPQMPA